MPETPDVCPKCGGDKQAGECLCESALPAAEIEATLASVPTSFQDSDSETPVTSEEAEDIREKILDIKRVIDDSYLDLGRLLYKTLHLKLYLQWGYAGFSDYCAGELGFQERKAQYFIALWKKIRVELGLNEDQIKGLGWTKLKEIAPILTKENADEVISGVMTGGKHGQPMSVREVQSYADDLRGGDDDDGDAGRGSPGEEKLQNFSVKLFPAQLQTVQDALTLAKKVYESDKQCYLLSSLCLEWQAQHLEGSDEDRLQHFLAQIEQRFKIKVVAFPNEKIALRVLELLEQEGKPA